jgi:predicted type IV restriction endonuclease
MESPINMGNQQKRGLKYFKAIGGKNMELQKLDSDAKKKIFEAKKMIEDVSRADGNEAETRRRVERIFEQVMGYDVFTHMSREYAVKGAGETEFCDWVIYTDEKEDANPQIFVELKKVNIKLAPKHLVQVTSYAINAGCQWVILTNGKDWQLFHVGHGQPPETKIVESWNLLEDDAADLAHKFNLISFQNVKRGSLEKLWNKRNVLTVHNIIKYLVSEESMRLLHRQLNKVSDVNISPEEIAQAIKRVLNETALTELNSLKISLKISLPEKKKRARSVKSKTQVVKEIPKITEPPKIHLEPSIAPSVD